MKPSAAALNAALADFRTLNFSKQKVSLYESLLVAGWFGTHDRYPDPSTNDANDAVDELFGVLPAVDTGRIYPFRYDWITADASGRKTVWNNTTRGSKLATAIFRADDVRQGLKPDACQIASAALESDRLPSLEALIVLLLRNYSFAPTDGWTDGAIALEALLGFSPADLTMITDDRSIGVPLLGEPEWTPDTIPDELGPPKAVAITAQSSAGSIPAGTAGLEEVVIDPRVERMLLRGIERSQCMLLVGPPGSGKGTLVRWLVKTVQANAEALGFAPDHDPRPLWRTPDESWSAFDLIGGLVPDASADLVWSNGLLLNAIEEDRWLVLDETNRADLDKIMGPLLTWLSGQEVEIGRTKAIDGSPIIIDWGDAPRCEVAGAEDDLAPSAFRAGTDWRLLGTYNPLDAQRVFRMGQALSRRFVVVPIPALSPAQFEVLLEKRYPTLSDDAVLAITYLYSSHYDAPETLLGPAVFLRMAAYLDGDADPSHAQIAEAYVANVGKFIGSFDDATFAALGHRVVVDEGALPSEQWTWISNQRSVLG